jgi:hypothetical protein
MPEVNKSRSGAGARPPVVARVRTAWQARAALIAFFALGMVAEPAAPSEMPTRSVWIAPTYDFLATSAFEPSSRHGFGASGAYEFHVSPRFNLGLVLAYRLYPGERVTQQLGYGTTLKHFFSSRWATADGFYPFVGYGLLMQQSYVEGLSGSAVSHDTRLGGGVVFRSAPIALYLDVGAHYSRLGFFERESEAIPYLDVQLGWVFGF